MNHYLHRFAGNCGVLGILISFAAIILRVLGQHYKVRYANHDAVDRGIALMGISCVLQLNFSSKR